jgi:hypothetical protein
MMTAREYFALPESTGGLIKRNSESQKRMSEAWADAPEMRVSGQLCKGESFRLASPGSVTSTH